MHIQSNMTMKQIRRQEREARASDNRDISAIGEEEYTWESKALGSCHSYSMALHSSTSTNLSHCRTPLSDV